MFLALFSAIMMHALSLLLAVFFEDFSTFVISTLLFGMSNLGIVSLTMTLAGTVESGQCIKGNGQAYLWVCACTDHRPFFYRSSSRIFRKL